MCAARSFLSSFFHAHHILNLIHSMIFVIDNIWTMSATYEVTTFSKYTSVSCVLNSYRATDPWKAEHVSLPRLFHVNGLINVITIFEQIYLCYFKLKNLESIFSLFINRSVFSDLLMD